MNRDRSLDIWEEELRKAAGQIADELKPDFELSPWGIKFIDKFGQTRSTPAMLGRIRTDKVSDFVDFIKNQAGRGVWPYWPARRMVNCFKFLLRDYGKEKTHRELIRIAHRWAEIVAIEYLYCIR